MTGIRTRVEAFLDWGWDRVSPTRGPQVLDRSDAARIDWGDDNISEPAATGTP
jgi:NADH:quinone reductase (non-electrogenic)